MQLTPTLLRIGGMSMRKLLTPVVVVLAVLAGAGVASAVGEDDTVKACYDRGGNLRLQVGDACPRGWTATEWSVTGPEGPPGPVGPSNGLYTMEREQLTLPAEGERTIASLRALPPGSYVFSAHTTAVNPDPINWTAVRCGIRAAGQDSFGTLGSAAAVGLVDPASWFAQAFVSLPVTSTETFDAELYCLQTRGSTTSYVEESRLYGIRVGSLEVRQ
jgi:hypothetical protein